MIDGSFFSWSFEDAGFQVILITTASLLAATGAFALVALALHARSELRHWRRGMLEARWQPLIDDVLAGVGSLDALEELVPNRHRRHLLRVLYRRARVAHDEHLDVLRSMARPYLSVLRGRRPIESAELRAQRIQFLGWLGDEEDVPRLVEALDDRSPLVAIVALRALIRRRAMQALDAMLDALPRFQFWNARTLASLLAELGPTSARTMRETTLDPSKPMRERLIALATLQEIGGSEAVDTAVSLLETTEPREMAAGALRILEVAGDAEHLDLVLDVVDSPDEVLRVRAVATLAALGAASADTALQAALHDESTWVAIQAARALANRGRTDVLEEAAAGDAPRAGLARHVLGELGGADHD